MTQEEQMLMNAATQFLERQVANVAREGASMAVQLEIVAQKCKALEAELAALKGPQSDQSNVTPIGKKPRKARSKPETSHPINNHAEGEAS